MAVHILTRSGVSPELAETIVDLLRSSRRPHTNCLPSRFASTTNVNMGSGNRNTHCTDDT